MSTLFDINLCLNLYFVVPQIIYTSYMPHCFGNPNPNVNKDLRATLTLTHWPWLNESNKGSWPTKKINHHTQPKQDFKDYLINCSRLNTAHCYLLSIAYATMPLNTGNLMLSSSWVGSTTWWYQQLFGFWSNHQTNFWPVTSTPQ